MKEFSLEAYRLYNQASAEASPVQGSAYYNLASLRLRTANEALRDPAAVLDLLTRCAEIAEQNGRRPPRGYTNLLKTAYITADRANEAQVIQNFQNILDPEEILDKARIEFEQGHDAEVLRLCEVVLRSDETHSFANYLVGAVLEKQKKIDAAINRFKIVISKQPGDYISLLLKVVDFEALKKHYAEALHWLSVGIAAAQSPGIKSEFEKSRARILVAHCNAIFSAKYLSFMATNCPVALERLRTAESEFLSARYYASRDGSTAFMYFSLAVEAIFNALIVERLRITLRNNNIPIDKIKIGGAFQSIDRLTIGNWRSLLRYDVRPSQRNGPLIPVEQQAKTVIQDFMTRKGLQFRTRNQTYIDFILECINKKMPLSGRSFVDARNEIFHSNPTVLNHVSLREMELFRFVFLDVAANDQRKDVGTPNCFESLCECVM